MMTREAKLQVDEQQCYGFRVQSTWEHLVLQSKCVTRFCILVSRSDLSSFCIRERSIAQRKATDCVWTLELLHGPYQEHRRN